MYRVAEPPFCRTLALCILALASAPLLAQTAPQAGPQTMTQSGIQNGVQSGIQQPSSAPQPLGTIPGSAQRSTVLPLPVLPPGMLELLKLETDFAESVAKGGGKAFSSWFADDGVTLNNGKDPVLGRRAIAAITNWDPKNYQLSWYVEGAQMGPSNDTGFTWGHYDATTIDPKTSKSSTASGRYITFWKKVDGKWKVALDASADEPPVAALPAPPVSTPPR